MITHLIDGKPPPASVAPSGDEFRVTTARWTLSLFRS
jgi:hypothetical protein